MLTKRNVDSYLFYMLKIIGTKHKIQELHKIRKRSRLFWGTFFGKVLKLERRLIRLTNIVREIKY